MSRRSDHHKQLDLCTSRAPYRQGRRLTAVKVYTINNESVHLLIFGVPKINLRTELKNLCQKYGDLGVIAVTNEYEVELFTECYHVSYEHIQSARIAKKKLDNSSFYGGILHVCYAPEYETLEETRAKLLQRRKDVFFKVKSNANVQFQEPNKSYIENYEEVIENVEVQDEEGLTTTSYNIKVISVKKNNQNEDNVTTIEVTTNAPVLKRRYEELASELIEVQEPGPSHDAKEMKI
uniref:RNA-binding protein 48 n=1 Tax=Xenopsylla cheopis TaxID=163159 RepID=A0A6M2DMX2_XENCH